MSQIGVRMLGHAGRWGFVQCGEPLVSVIPAKAGIQSALHVLADVHHLLRPALLMHAERLGAPRFRHRREA